MRANNEVPKTLTALLKATALAKWKGKTAKQFYSNVEQAIAFLGEGMEVSTHQVAQLKRFFEGKGLKPATVNQKLVNLHTVLDYGFENDWVQRVPKFSFDKIDNENARVRVVDETEETKLFAWLRENGYEVAAAFCELAVLTGCRRGELLLAGKANVSGNWLLLDGEDTKSGKGRPVPLTPRAKELADAFIPFKLTPYQLQKAWKEAKEALGLAGDDSLVFHTLRHTAATRLLRKSGNIKIVKELLGHAHLQTTERYAKITNDDLMNAVLR